MNYAKTLVVLLALASSCSSSNATRDSGSRHRALKSDKKTKKAGKKSKKKSEAPSQSPTSCEPRGSMDLSEPVTEFEFKLEYSNGGWYNPGIACKDSSENPTQWASQTGLEIRSLTTLEPDAFCLVIGGGEDGEETYRKRVLDSCELNSYNAGDQWDISYSEYACSDRECCDCNDDVPLETRNPGLGVDKDFGLDGGQFCFPVDGASVFRHVAAPGGNAQEYWLIVSSNSCLDPTFGG